jgi:hypothetical protein
MVLEAPAGATYLAACNYLHNVRTCEQVHIDFVSAQNVGASLQINGRIYIVEGMGPGYYLESGVVLQPADSGVPGLEGQRWVEVYPDEGKLHTSHSWHDLDGNQALSPLDTLALDADGALKVKDVRLLVRVRAAQP